MTRHRRWPADAVGARVHQPLTESPAALLPLARGRVRPPSCSIPSAEPTSTYTPLDAPRLSLKRVNSAGFLTPQLRTAAQLRSWSWFERLEAHQAAGAGAGGLAVLKGDLAGNDGRAVSVGLLDEAAAAGGEVEHHLRCVQDHAVEVDEVEVGPHARSDHA